MGNFQCNLNSEDILFFNNNHWRARRKETLEKQKEINSISIDNYVSRRLFNKPTFISAVANKYIREKYQIEEWVSYNVYKNDTDEYGRFSDECLYSFDTIPDLCKYFGITEQYYYTYFVNAKADKSNINIDIFEKDSGVVDIEATSSRIGNANNKNIGRNNQAIRFSSNGNNQNRWNVEIVEIRSISMKNIERGNN